MMDTINDWSTLILLWVGTPIQLLFVLLYLTRKWTKYRFSRALMWKSGALVLYLYDGWSRLLVAGLRDYDWPLWIDIQSPIIKALVFWAIVNQFYALVRDAVADDPDPIQTEVTAVAAEEIAVEEDLNGKG